ncbi:response regulator transcription factor [Pedobacter sp. N36a]|uniref:tetratricopeptide repeat protein n=1 Tax=Pedobacter sp. N36a TaxID=2767996 RepID=UPI001656E64C|nr:LuxR C-terminal-related transcriptional regulator [Pedobacter sp. N36a]MBC8986999.1 response regulator transcription factor [Pedobacter sp. N36a]
MFLRFLLLICATGIFNFLTPAVSQTINYNKLHEEISVLNGNNQHEKSLIKLESIISDPTSSAYDKYHAYLQKSLVYKQLYNYTGALTNLQNAYQEGQKTEHKLETETCILIERILIHYDLKNEKELLENLKQVDASLLHYVKKETLAFYTCVLGQLELKKDNVVAAEKYFDEGIKLLEKENPKHLPVLYKAKIQLYNKLKSKQKAQEAFNKGFNYAVKYGIDLYRIMMLESMIFYYVENDDYKNAYEVQKKVSEERRQYDAANRSGKLAQLEKEFLQDRNLVESSNQKKVSLLYVYVILLLFGLIITLFKLNKANKRGRLSTERELELLHFRLQTDASPTDTHGSMQPLRAADTSKLTPRHLKIIELVREGKTNKEIAAELFISDNTVKYHLKTIYDLLEVNNRSALM